MDGSEQRVTAQARRFANRLQGRAGLPVHLADERLSTREAWTRLVESGSRRGGPRPGRGAGHPGGMVRARRMIRKLPGGSRRRDGVFTELRDHAAAPWNGAWRALKGHSTGCARPSGHATGRGAARGGPIRHRQVPRLPADQSGSSPSTSNIFTSNATRIHMPLRSWRQYIARGSSSTAGSSSGPRGRGCMITASGFSARKLLRARFLAHVVLGLEPGDVDRVQLADHPGEVVRLLEWHAVLVQVPPDVAFHREVARGDEHHPDVAVVLHEVGERARGAPAAQVAHQPDRLAVDPAPVLEAALQRIDVEQRLGRMMVLAAAGVDDRDRPLDTVHQRRGLGRRPPLPACA